MLRLIVEMTYDLAGLSSRVIEPWTVYIQYRVYVSPQQQYIISLEYEGKVGGRGVEKSRWREGKEDVRGWSQIM